MNYHTITIKRLPNGYKNGEICPIIHFHLDNQDNFIQGDPLKQKYIDFITKEIASMLESQLLIFRPAIIGTKNNNVHMIMKDNCDFFVVKEKAMKLLKEVNLYTENKMDCYFKLDTIMIIQDGKSVNALKKRKMDSPYLQCDQYLIDCIRTKELHDKNELSATTPFEEFVILQELEEIKA